MMAMTVINTDDRDKNFYLLAVKFEPREDSSSPRFIPYAEDHAGLPEWISFADDRVRVPAEGKLEVPVRIAVPDDAASGTSYAAVLVSDAPYDLVASQGAPIQARVAVLVFFTVEGETDARAELLDFLPVSPAAIQENVTRTFRLRIQNQGNVVLAPAGTIVATDVFGRVVASADVNAEGSRVTPGLTRTFEVALVEDEMAVGPVTATLKVTYASDQPALFSSDSYWVFPWPFVIAAGFVCVMAVMLLRGAVRRRG